LLVFRPGDAITINAGPAGARMMLFGGDSIPTKRHIWWNFVSSSKERIEQAKAEWRSGRFDIVPGDAGRVYPAARLTPYVMAYLISFWRFAACQALRRLSGFTHQSFRATP
jgi:hypothetical protein